MADMTLSWPRLRCPAWARRKASPCRMRMSATSRDGRGNASAGRRPQVRERALHLAEGLQSDARVERRGVELLVAEQHLDDADVGAALQQVGGEAVAQGVERDPLVQRRRHRRGMADPAQLARGHWLSRIAAGEEPALGPRRPPPGAQQLQEIWREHDVAVLAALALLDADQHAP